MTEGADSIVERVSTGEATQEEYADIGLIAGLEIHQQLDTDEKLFCPCPTERKEPEEALTTIERYLHPTTSELGELDDAAVEESKLDRQFEYLVFDSTCLVEADEEPPHDLDSQARRLALEIAQLLDMSIVDQAHVMRKIVVDGSNTSGFQRTALIATDGVIETDYGEVGIEDLLLEEESAQRIKTTDDSVKFGLDRLGIPLVEIGTAPDIESPEEAKATAEHIGMLLRSTGAVKRGLGTIRQDVNISIAAGARVELKGVQELDMIDDIVRHEVTRQLELVDIAETLQERNASVGKPVEVTDVFAETDSDILAGAIGTDGVVMALPLPGFDGQLGREIQPDRRLGSELADHARRHGVGGLFHTDELPTYGITEAEVSSLRETLDVDPGAAVAFVAGEEQTARAAINAAAERALNAPEGVPEETRDVTPEATSTYLRPLPGAARMYPETDVLPVDLDPTEVEPPELLTEKVDRYVNEYDFAQALAEQVAYSKYMPVFERAVGADVDPTLAADVLEGTLTELRRDDVDIDLIETDHLLEIFSKVEAGELPREGIEPVLRELADEPTQAVEEAMESTGVGASDEAAVKEVIEAVVERNADQVEAEGMAAFSGLMGECMGELRGKADGEVVSSLLREAIQARQ